MTYKQTIDFLFTSLPMYQRVGDAAIKKDLTNIKSLCRMLDQPQKAFPAIHVAGTNGKGSTSHMLASVFQASGKKVGLYTSPHYVDFRERIRINGVMIGKNEVVRFVRAYHERWASIQPSFFEITVAMAFDHFRNQKVDIAIIETGLGGRLDSTTIILPRLSVITNIGYDHMQMLGHTLTAIAEEKAGIIKPTVPVIIGEWQKETAVVFKRKASMHNAYIHFASRHLYLQPIQKTLYGQSYKVTTQKGTWFEKITSDLTGSYQRKNIGTVLETIYRWNQYYPVEKIADKEIRSGIASVKRTTGMIGRWMVFSKKPLVITDAAHNEHGMKAMLPDLLRLPVRNRHFVLGFVADKDIKKVLRLFPTDGFYYWCSPDIPRGKPAIDVERLGLELNLQGNSFPSVIHAYHAALEASGKKDLIFVGGSSYVVGNFLEAK